MSEPLSWELEFINSMSGPLREIAGDMKVFSENLKSASSGMALLAHAQQGEKRAAHEAKEEHKGFFGEMFSAHVLAEQFIELKDKVGELAGEFVKTAIEAGDFDYKTTIALTHMTGSAEQAEDIMSRAKAFAMGTGEGLEDVVGQFQRLASTGLKGEQLTAAAAAAGDLARVSGMAAGSASELFTMIGSDRGLGARGAMQLRQYPALMKQMRADMGMANVPVEEFMKKVAGLKGAEGLKQFEAEVAKIAHEDTLGTVAYEMGNTFGGSWNKVKTGFEIMMGEIGSSPEINHLRQQVSDMLDGVDWKAMKGLVMDALSPVTGAIGEIAKNPKALQEFFSNALADLKVFMQLVSGLGTMFGAINSAMGAVGTFAAKVTTRGGFAPENTHEDYVAAAQAEKEGKGYQLANPYAKESGEVGYAPHAEGGLFEKPHLGMVAEKGPEAIIPASKLGSMGGSSTTNHNQITIQVKVDVPHGAHVDEGTLAAKFNELAPGALISALEQLNEQNGGG